MSSIRYADNTLANKIGDFTVRRRTPTLLQLLFIFIATFIIDVSLMVATSDKMALGAIQIILFSVVCSYVAIQLQRSRDLVLTTEFQNALFTSALGINNKFCLIIRQDGAIVYLDRSFQELFPDFIKQPRRTVGMLLTHGKLSSEDNKKVFAAIEHNVYDKVVFNLYDSQDVVHKIVMSIEPISRPSGFILLRCREFVDERSTAKINDLSAAPSPFNKSTIALFSYVMDTMDVGVYMMGPSGNFVYVNPILEQWLGFREGEITSSNLSLKDILHSVGEKNATMEPGNYEGGVTLQKKAGGLMQAFINQKIIRNEQDKTMGYTALVHNITGNNSGEQQKSW